MGAIVKTFDDEKRDMVVTLGRSIAERRLFKKKKYLKIFELRRETNRI